MNPEGKFLNKIIRQEWYVCINDQRYFYTYVLDLEIRVLHTQLEEIAKKRGLTLSIFY
jgi:hypothetical protein